eukprot:Tbor_TRINITY_DN1819_c0_g1::TRINITY_DN1819_c0_g1_i1::g.23089::m.23089/K05016/CLCN7; chloride channel 7
MLLIMVGISIAKVVSDSFSHPITQSFLEAKCVPVLDFASRIHKYDMFSARNVMKSPVITLTPIMAVGNIIKILETSTHNGFPVISSNDDSGRYQGLILRRQLEIIIWNTFWTRQTKEPCSYTRMRDIEDRLYSAGLSGVPYIKRSIGKMFIDISTYIDYSAYCIQEATSLSRTYHMFCTLGLRHLVIVNRRNIVIGIITRKDLVADIILERVRGANELRLAKCNAMQSVLSGAIRSDVMSEWLFKDRPDTSNITGQFQVDSNNNNNNNNSSVTSTAG